MQEGGSGKPGVEKPNPNQVADNATAQAEQTAVAPTPAAALTPSPEYTQPIPIPTIPFPGTNQQPVPEVEPAPTPASTSNTTSTRTLSEEQTRQINLDKLRRAQDRLSRTSNSTQRDIIQRRIDTYNFALYGRSGDVTFNGRVYKPSDTLPPEYYGGR